MRMEERLEILQDLPHGHGNIYRCVYVILSKFQNTYAISLPSFLANKRYDLFIVGIVMLIMNFLNPQNSTDPQLVSTAALIGAICGQLGFGFVADLTGVHRFVCICA